MSTHKPPEEESAPLPVNRIKTDNRYLPRWEVCNRVLYRRERESVYHECFSKDVNSEGACVSLPEMLPKGEKLVMTFYLNDDIAVRLEGRILWNNNNGQRILVGIRFENVSQQVQNIILQYAFNCHKEALTKHWFEGWNG